MEEFFDFLFDLYLLSWWSDGDGGRVRSEGRIWPAWIWWIVVLAILGTMGVVAYFTFH